MKSILLLCLISVAFLWSASNGLRISGADFDDSLLELEAEDIDSFTNEEDQSAKLSESCLIKILGPSVSCIMRSMSKWDVEPHQLKIDINQRPTCCSIWEMTDCLKNNAKTHCSDAERMAFNTHMNEQTELRNQRNCSLFQYESDSCADGHQESDESPVRPVLTKVSFRENNHFIDTNQLDNEVEDEKPRVGHRSHHAVPKKVFEDVQSGLGALNEMHLAQRLLDRVDRITINHMVIDLHPVRRTGAQPKQDLGDSQWEVEDEP